MKRLDYAFDELQSSWHHTKRLLHHHKRKHNHFFTKNNLLIAFLQDVQESTRDVSKTLSKYSKKKSQNIHGRIRKLQGNKGVFIKKEGSIDNLIKNLRVAEKLETTWKKTSSHTKKIEDHIQLHISDIESHIASMSSEYKKMLNKKDDKK